MNKATSVKNLRSEVMIGATIIIVAAVALIAGVKYADAAITSQMQFGARGTQVTELQQYLAADPTVYPEGLVTGYFGTLTQAAVQRFQCQKGIICSGTPQSSGYGRVGPMTLSIINSSTPNQGGDTSAPLISNVSTQVTNNTATVSFSTNELARAKVHYDIFPLRISNSFDATGMNSSEPSVSGSHVDVNTVSQSFQNISLTGLTPNTTYYYMIVVTDPVNNVSFTVPASFHTNN